jgi:hypothetical protein
MMTILFFLYIALWLLIVFQKKKIAFWLGAVILGSAIGLFIHHITVRLPLNF